MCLKNVIVSIDKYRLNHLNNKVMVKHIVLFKLKDEASADEKLAAMNDFKKAIEALPAKIQLYVRLK